MRSLVVDDSPTIRILLQHILSSYGTCDVTENGQEAMDAHAQALSKGHPYDLICLDLGLPYYDGIAVLARIRAAEAGCKPPIRSRIVVVTASREPGIAQKASALDADGCLIKPIVAAQLLEYLGDFGLVEDPRTALPYRDAVRKIDQLCKMDEIPVAVLARVIRSMADSIDRQSSSTEPDRE